MNRGEILDEYIDEDRYREEITRLNSEVEFLKDRLKEKEFAGKSDPFKNPTEYKGFSGSYAKIIPELETQNVIIPLEPKKTERKNLRRFYSIGGWCMIFQFLMTTAGAILLMNAVMFILNWLNPETNQQVLYDYMRSSSILASLNMLVYLVCNVLNAFIGMKWAKIKPVSIINTKNKNKNLKN